MQKQDLSLQLVTSRKGTSHTIVPSRFELAAAQTEQLRFPMLSGSFAGFVAVQYSWLSREIGWLTCVASVCFMWLHTKVRWQP